LTGLTLLLENAPGLSAAAFEERLELARQEASTLLKTVRDMTMDLRPPLLQDFGLVEALKSHFRRYSIQTDLPVEFELTGEERQQPARMAITAYRIIQEALTNVARHASASRVAVTLSFDRHETKLQVVDDGCGFDVAERRDESNGLAGMLERARSVGGTVRLSSGSTSGTTISAVLPFVAATEGGN
ncbi:MAG: ATP-binding protein, partial [Armatimonadota bacterium]